jgi:Integrase core domain
MILVSLPMGDRPAPIWGDIALDVPQAAVRTGDDPFSACLACCAEPPARSAAYRPRPTLGCRDHRCPIGRGLRYLAVVIDAFSSGVLGWALETHLDVSLALAARDMALAARRPAPDSLAHHADRGVQYAREDYTAKLAAQRIQPSMSRIGNPTTTPQRKASWKPISRRRSTVATIATSPQRASIAHFLEEVYTGNTCIPPSAVDPSSRSKPACRPCAWFSRRRPTRSHQRHDRQPVTGASQGEQGIFGRNKESNRRIRVISGGLRGRTFSALPDRLGGPKGPNIPAGGLQPPANSRE